MASEIHRSETKVFRYSWKPAAGIMGLALVAVGLLSLYRPTLIGSVLLIAAAAVFASYFASLALRVRLVIDSTGVTFIERSDKHMMTWENIHSVACGAVPGRKGGRQYKLLNHGNVVISFENEIADSERAYRTIERRISVDLYPRYREALERGDVVNFGVINLSRYNVNVRHVNVPVEDARLVREGNSMTLVRRSTAESVISVDEGEVQNINILLRCASEIDPMLVGNPKAFSPAA